MNTSISLKQAFRSLKLFPIVGIGILTFGCGDPNVPLTQPPREAFRVSSPRPRRTLQDRTPKPSPTPRLSLGQVTAQFFGIRWPEPPLLFITAEFFQVAIPKPKPSPSAKPEKTPAPVNSQAGSVIQDPPLLNQNDQK